MLPEDLPHDLPTFIERFGTDEQCHRYLCDKRWPEGFCCRACGHRQAWRLGRRNIYECAACGQQHSLLKGTIFEQTKSGLARWCLAIYLVSASKGGISALELQRQMGLGSYQTAWTWLHKIGRAMVRPGRAALTAQVEADETYGGGAEPGKPGRGGGKSVVAGASRAVVARPAAAAWAGSGWRWCPTSRPRASRASLAGTPARPATVTTDGWAAYGGLAAAGYRHAPINLSASWGDAALRLPAIHLVFSLAKRWLLGTHHGAVQAKHLPASLDELVFRFNRRTAKSISHRFARVIEHAVQLPPTTYRTLVAAPA